MSAHRCRGHPAWGAVAAFTIIELLVVIGIIAVLTALLFPVLATVRRRGAEKVCFSNLRQLGMAVRMYMQDHDGGRPDRLHTMLGSYLSDRRLLVCPADGVPGGYASKVFDVRLGPPIEVIPVFTSYNWFIWTDDRWAILESRGPRAGMILDRVHGEPRSPYQRDDRPWPHRVGRTIRLHMDGSVRIVNIPRAATSWWGQLTYNPGEPIYHFPEDTPP